MTENEYCRMEGGQVMGEAIMFMRSRPRNPDGTIGFIVKPDMPEWPAWLAYFEANGMARQAGVMRSRNFSGYTVPCANPATFDPTFRSLGGVRHERNVDLSGEERAEISRRVLAKWRVRDAKKYRPEDGRDDKPAMPESRPLNEREADSMRRLMGAPRMDYAAE